MSPKKPDTNDRGETTEEKFEGTGQRHPGGADILIIGGIILVICGVLYFFFGKQENSEVDSFRKPIQESTVSLS
ncbi:MAG: hypothetical protein AAF821_26940 [Cyanobacteria bacterium P01_D01_bin.156]